MKRIVINNKKIKDINLETAKQVISDLAMFISEKGYDYTVNDNYILSNMRTYMLDHSIVSDRYCLEKDDAEFLKAINVRFPYLVTVKNPVDEHISILVSASSDPKLSPRDKILDITSILKGDTIEYLKSCLCSREFERVDKIIDIL